MVNHRQLLVMFFLLFIRGHHPLPTTSEALSYALFTFDYDETTVSAASMSPKEDYHRCDYDSCRENQVPCDQLSASSGCLCPGFTLPDMAPLKPILKHVYLNGSVVMVQWCEPLSHVTSYVVTVGGEEKQMFENYQRRGTTGKIDNIAEVCVVAVNEVGKSEGSCTMYHPTDNSLPLTAGLIGGALAFLLLLLLAVLLWRRRRQRKHEATVSMANTVERQ